MRHRTGDSVAKPPATAKRPQQRRAVERFERVLATAETLLRTGGLRAFSIPAIADELGCTRGSIYAHFPTPDAVLNELSVRYLGQIFARFAGMAGLSQMPWREGIRTGGTRPQASMTRIPSPAC